MPQRVGKRRMCTGTMAFDASYPTGGEPVTPSDFGFKKAIDSISLIGGKGGYVGDFDKTNSKILMYYADYDALADSALIQFPNATSLAALTAVRFIALGT